MDGIAISRTLTVPTAELTWRTSASGGPGGQHANRANTRVELVWELEGSSIAPETLERLSARFGPRLRVVVDETRSQHRNREIAEERLVAQVTEALRPVRKRRATKPSRGANERRIKAKKRRSDTKRQRRWSGD